MRYPATEKLEIIRIVEQSHLPVRQTLDKLGIPRPTFYRWYDRFLTHGVEGLEDRTSAPSRVWNRIPDDIRDRIITMALDHADLSPRELAVRFTDTESYFVSEASVYRLLKAHDLHLRNLQPAALELAHPDAVEFPQLDADDGQLAYAAEHFLGHMQR